MPIAIFFCYAHEDEALLNKLKAHLRPLHRQGLIEMQYDRDISAGSVWKQEIDLQINSADVILLLVSPDFMASDFCYGFEMKRAIERHEKGDAKVIPVILRPVYWQGVLGNLQALPKDAKPVTSSSWHNEDEAFFDIVEGIRKVVKDLTTIGSSEFAVRLTFGELLRQFRKRARLTQSKLSEKLANHPNMIAAWERGDSLPRTQEMIMQISKALKLNEEDTNRLLEASLWLQPSGYSSGEPNSRAAIPSLPNVPYLPTSDFRSSENILSQPTTNLYEYDVAFSYAREDRTCVAILADILKRNGIKVFFDQYEKPILWGKDLYTHLADIYNNKALYCVVFISQNYAKKVWTKHELKAAQERALREKREYILPIRIDDTEIPSILSTTAYLSWPSETADSIANAILKKLNKVPLTEHPLLTEQEVATAAERIGPAIVRIEVDYESKIYTIGKSVYSGFIFASDGYILTVASAIPKSRHIKITLADGRIFAAGIIGIEFDSNVAVLRIGAINLPIPEWRMAPVRIGLPVIALGKPYGLNLTISTGEISSLERIREIPRSDNMNNLLQTNISVSSGSMGGPLVDSQGRVIGMIIASTPLENWCFSIPLETINSAIVSIDERHKAERAGILGVGGMRVPIDLAKRQGLHISQQYGLEVVEIRPDSPADHSELNLMDVIIDAEGEPITEPADLRHVLSRYQVGEKVVISFLRGDKQFKVIVEL